MSINKFI